MHPDYDIPGVLPQRTAPQRPRAITTLRWLLAVAAVLLAAVILLDLVAGIGLVVTRRVTSGLYQSVASYGVAIGLALLQAVAFGVLATVIVRRGVWLRVAQFAVLGAAVWEGASRFAFFVVNTAFNLRYFDWSGAAVCLCFLAAGCLSVAAILLLASRDVVAWQADTPPALRNR
ncbi:hypothetical protein [Fodinicola acaciae]|uniref:hypothetical protein n=1 Tax=Fodinicola acaciae TaxID=2681555 RepID=UPI0013D07DD7|nr:hypothetical protein [Fodinicola acaciae]